MAKPAAPDDPIAVLRNEELVLMRAQILWGLNRDAEAIQMINLVRQAAGLAPVTAASFANHGALLRGILKEKRYSLLFETAARWVDYRMFGILNELGTELGNAPIPRLPIPQNEADARSGSIACTP
jgi:hypothetical protein